MVGIMIENLLIENTIEKVFNNIFVFDKYFSAPDYDAGVEINPIDFEVEAFGDIEWTNVLNRMEYCIELCYYSDKTGKNKYAEKAKEFILLFASLYKNKNENSKIRTLDTGIRLITWDKCIEFFQEKKMLTENELNLIIESITWQMKYLVTDFEEFQRLSNWGLTQSIGFLNCLKYVRIDIAYTTFYEKIFNTHLDVQFYNDGMQWEQSMGYQNDVVIRMIELNNDTYINEKYVNILEKACEVINALTTIDGKSVPLGDGDEIDTNPLLQKVAIKLDKMELANFDIKYEDVHYQFKYPNIEKYNNIINTNEVMEYNFLETGLVVRKDSDNYFSFQNGPLGYGHGHFDNLHVNLGFAGNKILTDRGRYCYVSDNPKRKQYKWFESHNGPMLLNNEIEYIDSWTSSGYIENSPMYRRKYKMSEYLQSTIRYDDKFTSRECINILGKLCVLIDYANEESRLNYTLYPGNKLIGQKENTLRFENFNLKVINGDNIEINKSTISPKYLFEEDSSSIKIDMQRKQKVISIFSSNEVKVSEYNNYTYTNSLRLTNEQKNFQVFKIEIDNDSYILAINTRQTTNCDSSIDILGETIMARMFMINIKTKEIDIYAR